MYVALLAAQLQALSLLSSDAQAKPADPPALVQVQASDETGAVDLVLAGSLLKHKALAADLSDQRDPLSTALTPKLPKGPGAVLDATGYRLTTLFEPGDTRVTYRILLELGETDQVSAWWYEDHREVPTRLFVGTGTLSPAAQGARALTLQAKDVDSEATVTLTGLVSLPPS